MGDGACLVLKGGATSAEAPQRQRARRAEEQKEGGCRAWRGSDATWGWTCVSVPRTSPRLDKFYEGEVSSDTKLALWEHTPSTVQEERREKGRLWAHSSEASVGVKVDVNGGLN